jgi:hypothetical protein
LGKKNENNKILRENKKQVVTHHSSLPFFKKGTKEISRKTKLSYVLRRLRRQRASLAPPKAEFPERNRRKLETINKIN